MSVVWRREQKKRLQKRAAAAHTVRADAHSDQPTDKEKEAFEKVKANMDARATSPSTSPRSPHSPRKSREEVLSPEQRAKEVKEKEERFEKWTKALDEQDGLAGTLSTGKPNFLLSLLVDDSETVKQKRAMNAKQEVEMKKQDEADRAKKRKEKFSPNVRMTKTFNKLAKEKMGKTALCPTPEEMIEGLFRACLHEKKPTSPKKSEAPIDTDVETWAEGLRCPEGVLSPPPPPPKVQASRPAKELDEHRYRELLIRLELWETTKSYTDKQWAVRLKDPRGRDINISAVFAAECKKLGSTHQRGIGFQAFTKLYTKYRKGNLRNDFAKITESEKEKQHGGGLLLPPPRRTVDLSARLKHERAAFARQTARGTAKKDRGDIDVHIQSLQARGDARGEDWRAQQRREAAHEIGLLPGLAEIRFARERLAPDAERKTPWSVNRKHYQQMPNGRYTPSKGTPRSPSPKAMSRRATLSPPSASASARSPRQKAKEKSVATMTVKCGAGERAAFPTYAGREQKAAPKANLAFTQCSRNIGRFGNQSE